MDSSEKLVFAEAIHSMYQAPLYHLILEGLLVLWILRLLFFKSYKLHEKVSLTKKEKEELISEWQPEPLVPPLEKTLSTSVPYKLITGRPAKTIIIDQHECLNMATMDFLGLANNTRIEEAAAKSIKKYGVGSCGPRAFYGTIDVHVELEKQLAKYMQSEKAIIYSYGFATVASAIPAYAKRGDLIFADEAVCFAVQKGLHASRSKIVYFKHNDLDDLEDKLIIQQKLDLKNPKKASVTRKFVVVEGIYMNTGQLCDLPKLVELKYKYKVRLIVEESLSFGVLGDHGRGVTEHFNVPIGKVDLVCASMEYSLGSIGGFCCGRSYVVDHQCLSGQGYVFSASLPSLCSVAAMEGLKIMEEDPGMFATVREKGRLMQELLTGIPGIEIVGYPDSPSFHLKRSSPVSAEEDSKFLTQIVDQCMKNGVCITKASRLTHVELHSDWPASIRVAVSTKISDDELKDAAKIIRQAALDAQHA